MASGQGVSDVDGSLHSKDGLGTVRVEARLGADVHDVWKALTDPGALTHWLGEFDGDLRVGGQYRSRFHASGAEASGRVTECDPPGGFTVVTRGSHASNEQVVRATLSPEGDGTVVVVEQSGLRPDWLAAFGAGLQVHVEDLAGRGRCDSDARMDQLVPVWDAKAVDGPA